MTTFDALKIEMPISQDELDAQLVAGQLIICVELELPMLGTLPVEISVTVTDHEPKVI